MSEYEQLIGLGFTASSDGTLRVPSADVTLKPIAQSYYELTIRIGGNQISCVVAAVGLKLAPPSEAVVDPEALISFTTRRRPW